MRSILMHQAVFTFEFEYKVPTIVIPLLFFENRYFILLDGMTTRETLTLPALSKQTEFPRKVLGRFLGFCETVIWPVCPWLKALTPT